MVFDLPDIVEAQGIGQLDLVERVLEQLQLQAFGPRPGKLVFIEDAKSHRRPDPQVLSLIINAFGK
jgi:hypothetical protein